MKMQHKLTLSAAVLAISGLTAAPSFAQTIFESSDPNLTTLFATDGGFIGFNQKQDLGYTGSTLAGNGGANYVQSNGLGIGWSNGNAAFPEPTLFSVASTETKSQSVFQAFTYTGSTLNAGDSFQIGLHGYSSSDVGNAAETVYASIFSYNSSTTGAPIGSTIISPLQVAFDTAAGTPNDDLYFSATTTLANSLVSGQTYVLGIAGNTTSGAGTAAEYVAIDKAVHTTANKFTPGPFNNVYFSDNNSAFTGTSAVSQGSENPIAFRIEGANAPAAAPEASSFVSMGAFLAMLGAFLVKRRFTTAAAE